MKPCRPYSETGLIAFSFTRAIEQNRLTFMSSGMIPRRSSGSIRLERSQGFSRKEINQIQAIVTRSQQDLLDQWNEYFNG